MLSTSCAPAWPNTMNEANDKDDGALDSYLSGDSELSRRYRSGGAPQPSASVDRAILEAARKEAAAPAPRRRRFKLRWERPVAIAAAVTLSAIVLVSIEREAGLLPPEHGAAERALDYRNGAARPAAGSAEEQPAAPEQEVDASFAPRVLSDAPASSEAARSAKGAETGSLTAEDPAIEEELARIDAAWQRGEAERAKELLEKFREAYPNVGEDRLREVLPAALLRP